MLDVDSVDAVARVSHSQIRPLSHADACLSGVIEAENEMLRGILNIAALSRHIPDLQRYIPRVEDQRKAADEGSYCRICLFAGIRNCLPLNWRM